MEEIDTEGEGSPLAPRKADCIHSAVLNVTNCSQIKKACLLYELNNKMKPSTDNYVL